MPRYFFHICDGVQDIDRLGHDFPDDAAAKREAIKYGGGLIGDDPDIVARDDQLRINVTDEAGRLSCSIIVLAVDANWQLEESGAVIDAHAVPPRG